MSPAAILMLFNGALTAFEVLQPKVKELMASGDVTPEEQAALRARLEKLRTAGAFSGPAWEPTDS